ncbi:MAG: YihY/virulence factor BrkB family protein [Caldilineaceae bacterium]|nr:YihY/virulence factor BrkB family protein [Caldilineaceae bacterium]
MIKYFSLLREAVVQWQQDDMSRMAAALAYFTAISIAPLSLLIILIAGFLWGGERAVRMELMHYMQTAIGPEGAHFVSMAIENADRPTFGSVAGIISAGALLWGSTNVFAQLQYALNKIWNVTNNRNILTTSLKQRSVSFAVVLVIIFLLLVSVALSTAAQTMLRSVRASLPGVDWLWQVTNFVVSILFSTMLFASIFKVLPDIDIPWSDVWQGAVVTACLFEVGRFLLSYYLAQVSSFYGVAGSMLAFLIWVYFSAQIIFLGGEFTQVYSRRCGSFSDKAFCPD